MCTVPKRRFAFSEFLKIAMWCDNVWASILRHCNLFTQYVLLIFLKLKKDIHVKYMYVIKN